MNQELPIDGSLDEPPIRVRKDKSVAALAVIASVIVASVYLKNSDFFDRATLVIFGLAGLGGVFNLIKPGYMEISPTGISLCDLFWRKNYRWSDFSRFALVKDRHIAFNWTAVGYFYSDSAKGLFPMRYLNFYSGADGVFSIGYVLKPSELLDLINQAQARWHPKGS